MRKGERTPFALDPLSDRLSSNDLTRRDEVDRLSSGLELLNDDDSGVVLEVLADAGKVNDGSDAVRAEERGGADTGELEELRGLDGPGGEDDFFGSAL